MNDAENPVIENEPSTSQRTRPFNINRANSTNHRNRLRRQQTSRTNPGFVRFRRQQQHFIKRVYLLAIAFISLTVFQWITIATNPIFVEFLLDKHYISLIAGFLALLLVTLFAVVLEIRFTEPYNWITAYTIVELETLALIRSALDTNLRQLVICFLLSVGINVVFRFIGILIPRDLTKDICIIFLVSFLFYVAATFIVVLLIAREIYQLRLFLIVGTFILLLVYVLYMSQLIMGNRIGSLRWSDFMLAALMVYFNFMFIYSTVLYLWNEWISY